MESASKSSLNKYDDELLLPPPSHDDNHANRITCWESVNYGFREDKRIAKAIRTNPVMLRLFIMAMLQHPELQVGKGSIEIEGKCRMTLHRWRQACRVVCNEWVRDAEEQAGSLLEDKGVFGMKPEMAYLREYQGLVALLRTSEAH
nr:hypothetical protein [Endozoicomonas sp.]